MDINRQRTFVPRPDRTKESEPVNGEVTTRMMTDDERERYKDLKPDRDMYGRRIKKPILQRC